MWVILAAILCLGIGGFLIYSSYWRLLKLANKYAVSQSAGKMIEAEGSRGWRYISCALLLILIAIVLFITLLGKYAH